MTYCKRLEFSYRLLKYARYSKSGLMIMCRNGHYLGQCSMVSLHLEVCPFLIVQKFSLLRAVQFFICISVRKYMNMVYLSVKNTNDEIWK